VSGWRGRWYTKAIKLTDEEFRNQNLPQLDQILPTLSWMDATDFQNHWGKGNEFAAHFDGTLVVEDTGSYEIQLRADSEATLKIDGFTFLEVTYGSIKEDIFLEKGKEYVLELNYYVKGGGYSYLQLKWRRLYVGTTRHEPVPGSFEHGVSATPKCGSTNGFERNDLNLEVVSACACGDMVCTQESTGMYCERSNKGVGRCSFKKKVLVAAVPVVPKKIEIPGQYVFVFDFLSENKKI